VCRGGRECRLEIESHPEHGDTVEISVPDSGRGIAEGDKDRVFDAFRTTQPGALGMGLAIDRQHIPGKGIKG
jgi:signal transduction histidine kinase